MSFTSLKNHLLIAMPSLADPVFSHAVTYICEHSPEGALGIVINRILDISVGDVLQQIGIASGKFSQLMLPVHWGGPVQPEQGFILHAMPGHWASTLLVSDEIGLTTSRDILEAIGAGQGPDAFLLALGYAGWGAGQLEAEIKENAWLHGPATLKLLFEEALDRRWHAAAQAIGVDLTLLSETAGHA